MLKARPPKGHKLTPRISTARSDHAQPRSTSSASPSRRSASRAANQIVIQLAGVHDPADGREADRQDRRSSSCSTSRRPRRAVRRREREPGRRADALRPARAGADEGGGQGHAGGVLPLPRQDDTSTTKATSGKKGEDRRPRRRSTHTLLQGPADTKQALLKPYGGKAAGEHARSWRVPGAPRPVVNCLVSTGTAASAPGRGRLADRRRTTTCSSTTRTGTTSSRPIPEMTGGDLVALGHARRLRPEQASRSCCSSSPATARTCSRGSRRPSAQRGAQRYAARGQAGQTRRTYAQHFAIVLDGELKSTPYIDFTTATCRTGSPAARRSTSAARSFTDAKNLALVLQTGALPVSFQQIERTDVSATLGKELAEPGVARRARRPPRSSRSSCSLLYRFLGLVAVLRARDLRAPLLRGDPALQRDADAAGLRRPDPHDRRRGRRERRRLRTHQGRGARRASPCAPRSRPATARASTRSSTRTSSPRSRRSSSS